MEAVKEAVIEQMIDDLTLRLDRFDARFVRTEERNREEHVEIRAVIRELRSETNGGFRDLHRTMIVGFASIVASVLGSAVAAIVTNTV